MLKYFVSILVLSLFANSAYAQYIRYNETLFGNYVPSPPYRVGHIYDVDSFGNRIKHDDSLEIFEWDSNGSNIQWENAAGYNPKIYDYSYFQIRYETNNLIVLSKFIRVAKYVAGLFNPANLWDSVHIYYTYDSSTGNYLLKNKYTQLLNKKGKVFNSENINYYFDGNGSDTLIIYQRWDAVNSAWKDSAKSIAKFIPSMGIPQWYYHWIYANNKWMLHTVDSMLYDSASNPKAIFTQVNHNGNLVDSSRRFMHRLDAHTLENVHWIWIDSAWIKDTIAIFYTNYNGIATKLFKFYDPKTQIAVKAIKCNYANPDLTGLKQDINNSANFQIYPNPTLGTMNIDYTLDAAQEVLINIYNLMGKEVRHIEYSIQDGGKHHAQIDLTELPEGIYFIKFQCKETQNIQTLIKQ